jgi:hypothetical protein
MPWTRRTKELRMAWKSGQRTVFLPIAIAIVRSLGLLGREPAEKHGKA